MNGTTATCSASANRRTASRNRSPIRPALGRVVDELAAQRPAEGVVTIAARQHLLVGAMRCRSRIRTGVGAAAPATALRADASPLGQPAIVVVGHRSGLELLHPLRPVSWCGGMALFAHSRSSAVGGLGVGPTNAPPLPAIRSRRATSAPMVGLERPRHPGSGVFQPVGAVGGGAVEVDGPGGGGGRRRPVARMRRQRSASTSGAVAGAGTVPRRCRWLSRRRWCSG